MYLQRCHGWCLLLSAHSVYTMHHVASCKPHTQIHTSQLIKWLANVFYTQSNTKLLTDHWLVSHLSAVTRSLVIFYWAALAHHQDLIAEHDLLNTLMKKSLHSVLSKSSKLPLQVTSSCIRLCWIKKKSFADAFSEAIHSLQDHNACWALPFLTRFDYPDLTLRSQGCRKGKTSQWKSWPFLIWGSFELIW